MPTTSVHAHACLLYVLCVSVDRGGHVSMDVSADLTELGKTPVAVVCAGAKSVSGAFSNAVLARSDSVPLSCLS